MASSCNAALAQSECTSLKSGTFYSYPKNTLEQWKSERTGEYQKETNLVTGDTSLWKVSWQKGCNYTLKYVSGGKDLKKEELAFVKQHVLVFTVNSETEDYYVFSEYVDKVSKTPFLADTMWKREKARVTDNRLFSEIKPQDLRKLRFKDTSQYALVYVYRPGKLVCSIISYILYCNDIPMSAMKSKSAYVFKVYKEGPVKFWAENKNGIKSYIDLSIQFGKKYYLNCDINWSADRCIPDLSEDSKEKGETRFNEALY